MKEHDQEEIGKLLRDAFPANDARAGLERDLWPAMLRRIGSGGGRVPWYDWALAGGLTAMLVAFPGFLVVLAFHV